MEILPDTLSLDLNVLFASEQDKHVMLKYGAAAWISYRRHGFFWWMDDKSFIPSMRAVCFTCGPHPNPLMGHQNMSRFALDTSNCSDILMAFALDELLQQFEKAGCHHWIGGKKAGVPSPIPGLHDVKKDLEQGQVGLFETRLAYLERARMFLFIERVRERHRRRHRQ